MFDQQGNIIAETVIAQGSTIAHFDTRKIYPGIYYVTISDGVTSRTEKLEIIK